MIYNIPPCAANRPRTLREDVRYDDLARPFPSRPQENGDHAMSKSLALRPCADPMLHEALRFTV